MNSLILDCSYGMRLGLIKGDESFFVNDESQKKHTDELLVSLDRLLSENHLNLKQIDNICVCVGPGSFTGIRVAISIVKGLAVVNNFKIWTLSNFDCYDVFKSKNYYLILEGFSDFVYVRKCVDGVITDSCEKVLDIQKELEDSKFDIFVQNEKTQKMLNSDEKQCKFAQNIINFAFLNKIQTGENVLLEQICPIYLRASQAEIERAKRLAEKK